MANIPEFSVPIARTEDGRIEKSWYQALASLFNANNTLANAAGSALTMPGNITALAAPDTRLTKAQIKTFLAIAAASDVSGLAAVATAGTYASLTGTWTFVDSISGIIIAPANQDYVVGLSMPYAFTLNTMTTIALSGTCTLVTKKNTTAVTGLSNAVSTTQVVATATAGNAFVVGDDVRLTVSANASCSMAAFNMKITRTLP